MLHILAAYGPWRPFAGEIDMSLLMELPSNIDLPSISMGSMSQAHVFAIGVLLAWLAGIRVYLTVFGVGIAGAMGWIELPSALAATESPWVLGVSGALALAEFFADKIPGVDSGWDLLHTLLRVPVGAFLAAAAMSPDGSLGPGVLATGAGVALTSHFLKSSSRAVLNTSPEPVSNWTASVGEDVVTVGGLTLAFTHPWVALAIVITATVVFAAFVWWVWRKVTRGARRLIDGASTTTAASIEPPH